MTMEWHNNNITFGKLQQLVQGDLSGCSLGVVDIKTKDALLYTKHILKPNLCFHVNQN